MKMISIDDIIEICDTNIQPLKARGQGVAVAALRRVKDTVKEYAVDAELVKHGRWEINCDGYYPYCSNCKKEPQGREMTSFCPNCGARMDGGEENETD